MFTVYGIDASGSSAALLRWALPVLPQSALPQVPELLDLGGALFDALDTLPQRRVAVVVSGDLAHTHSKVCMFVCVCMRACGRRAAHHHGRAEQSSAGHAARQVATCHHNPRCATSVLWMLSRPGVVPAGWALWIL